MVALKAKRYERTLAQEESATALTVSVATTTIITTGIALTATSDTRNIKVPYYTHYYKSYYTKEKC